MTKPTLGDMLKGRGKSEPPKSEIPLPPEIGTISLEVPNNGDSGERAIRLFELINSAMDELTPVICIGGETGEKFFYKGEYIDVAELISASACTGGQFDVVMSYKASDWTFDFPTTEYRENFGALDIVLRQGGTDNIVPGLIDRDTLNASQQTDRATFAIIEQLTKKLEESEQYHKGAFVIIDRADMLFTKNGSMAASSEKVHNEAILGDLTRALARRGHRVILIDRSSEMHKNERLQRELIVQLVPALTKADVARVIREENLNPTDSLVSLSMGIPVAELKKIIRETAPEDVLNTLKRAKESAIERAADGSLKCSVEPIGKDQVHMTPEEAEMWDGIKTEVIDNPDLLSGGMILVGPPGTGKTIRAEYLASALGIPFMALDDVGSEGWRGVKEKKFRAAIETAIANKPCVLFIDEIDKIFPRTEGNRAMVSNDDAEVTGYIQKMIGSKEMEGVVIVAGANDPDQMNEALLRSGRFGTRVAVLPPEDLPSKIAIFTAVKNQINSLRTVQLSEEFISTVVSGLPPKTTGADYKEILQDGARMATQKGIPLEEAILIVLRSRNFEKSAEFDRFTAVAKRMHNAAFIPWKTEKDEEPLSAEEQKAIQIARWESAVRLRDEHKQRLASDIEKLKKEKAKLARQAKDIEDDISGLKAKHKQKDRDISARLERLETQARELAQERQALETEQAALDKRLGTADAEVKALEAKAAQLRDLIEQAQRWQDPAFVEQVRQRRQWIANTLRSAVVLGAMGFGAPFAWDKVTTSQEERAWKYERNQDFVLEQIQMFGARSLESPVRIGKMTMRPVTSNGDLFSVKDWLNSNKKFWVSTQTATNRISVGFKTRGDKEFFVLIEDTIDTAKKPTLHSFETRSELENFINSL